MYEEPTLEICYGPMKSGKSRYLVQKAEQLFAKGVPFLAFKPSQDTRDGCFIRSRDTSCRDIEALGIDSAAEILSHFQSDSYSALCVAPQGVLLRSDYLPAGQTPQACLIDEVFFLDSGLLAVFRKLVARGVSVYLSGLDRDFRREYFPLRDFNQTGKTMQAVIEACQRRIAVQAICEACGAAADFSQRLLNGSPAHYDSPTVLIGDEEYQPRCGAHHEVLGHPQMSLAS